MLEMGASLEKGIEWLRPIVNNRPWDYCVIWKLGDDPSRFIEWAACCCSSGRRGDGVKIMGANLIDECKDSLIKHPIASNACRKLAHLPSAIPLYSGVHGDVVMSKRARWTTNRSSNADDEANGTQVLIPVTWGLIELFTSKHVPRDQKTIDYFSARFRGPLKQESVESSYQLNLPPWLHYPNLGCQMSQPTNYSSFEGSSTCSSLSNEHQSLQLGPDHRTLSEMSLEKSIKGTAELPRLRRRKCAYFALSNNGNEKVGAKTRQEMERGPFLSKNLMTERKRRKRIKDREYALRALVPNISKMDKVGTLVDAADYIKELEVCLRNYNQELEALEEEDCNEVIATAERPLLVSDCADKKGSANENTAIPVGVEVFQLGAKDFLVKVISKQRRGAFSRLIGAIDCLGLEVADVNVSTLHGLVSNVLTVEAMRADLDPNTLKHSLVELVN
ncbi:transcription factor bHLH90-like isoform X1 [Salvia divinorum]|uniref:Transcription factor bHLH90-like isoform X1 n=2 Tax=Salvia divinorum TaxID=28513 RepID=A0ABD1H8Z0_SALDI